uniref:Uncharacterized protein n=2 Tax=Panagrolaimus TaxID=55784 RepID=A0A914PTI9_9BILA
MLKKAKKSRRSASGAAAQQVRAVQSEGSPSSYGHQSPHLGIDMQMSHGRSTPEELHHAMDDDEEMDAFL